MDGDAIFNLLGKPDPALTFLYQFVAVGPPLDAPLLDACMASLSTMLSTIPVQIDGRYYRDVRPAIPNASAIITDLEKRVPRHIIHRNPYTPIRTWHCNVISSSMIMQSYHERNQNLLARTYLDLVTRHEEILRLIKDIDRQPKQADQFPNVYHINLPYVGSTEASTNMRQAVASKEALMEKFSTLLQNQLDDIPFDQETNIIYGAGGFSGILAGLVTTRAVEKRFCQQQGIIKQIYGVSAGVINGFFHAVQIAAQQTPQHYLTTAQQAINDLENFFERIEPRKIMQINKNPLRLWHGLANLSPLASFLAERLKAYTGCDNPYEITFDAIQLPLTVAVGNKQGTSDFLGMTSPERRMKFANQEIKVKSAPIIQAILAGWSMNTYIEPTHLNGAIYQDGGGTFYDIGLFTACLDETLTNLINIHLDEPEGHSYNLPEKPNIVRILFDAHNYYFPEERRRMLHLTNLLYEHYQMRLLLEKIHPDTILPIDFRQNWELPEPIHEVS